MILEALFLLTFGVGDTFTTLYGLKLGASELNPAVKYIIKNSGFLGFILYKVFGSYYILVYAPDVLLFADVVGSLIVAWNLLAIWKAKSKS